MKPLFLLVALLGLSLASCQKDHQIPADPAQLTLDIRSPRSASLFRKGDTVQVAADVSYPGELHGYTLTLTDSASDALLWSKDAHMHGDQFGIHEQWVDTLSRAATVLLKMTVEIDHDGHEAGRTVLFYSQP